MLTSATEAASLNRRIILLLLALASAAGATTISFLDLEALPNLGASGVIELSQIPSGGPFGDQVELFTTQRWYTSPLYSTGSFGFTEYPVDITVLGGTVNPLSHVAAVPNNPNDIYETGGRFVPILYTFRLSPPAFSSVPLQGLTAYPTSLATGSAGVFVGLTTGGIAQVDTSDGATTAFATSGPGAIDDAAAMAFGPDGMLYALSPTQARVVRYDPSNGSYQGEFAISTCLSSTPSMTISSSGRLYIMDVGCGSGGVVLSYAAASGTLLDSLTSEPFAADVGINTGQHSSLLLASDNNLYYETGTGQNLYIYQDSALSTPEPSAFWLTLFAAVVLAGKARWDMIRAMIIRG
jgi:hypothetical protein